MEARAKSVMAVMMIMRMKMSMRIIVMLMMMKTIMKGIQVAAKKTAFQAAREVILAMEKIRRGTFMRRQSTIGNWKGTVQQEQPHTTECAWLTLIYPGFDFNERVK